MPRQHASHGSDSELLQAAHSAHWGFEASAGPSHPTGQLAWHGSTPDPEPEPNPEPEPEIEPEPEPEPEIEPEHEIRPLVEIE